MNLLRLGGPQVKKHTLKGKNWFSSFSVSGPFSSDLPPQVHKAKHSTQNQMPCGMRGNGWEDACLLGVAREAGCRGHCLGLPWSGCFVCLWENTKGISASAMSLSSLRAPTYPTLSKQPVETNDRATAPQKERTLCTSTWKLDQEINNNQLHKWKKSLVFLQPHMSLWKKHCRVLP